MTSHTLTIHEAHQLLKDKEISSVELTRMSLERIEKIEPDLKALVTPTAELALEKAREADGLIARGEANPLTGIPAIIKDNICTKGTRTTCSSKIGYQ